MSPSVLLLFFLLLARHSDGNYRHYHLDNADICDGGGGDDQQTSSSLLPQLQQRTRTLILGSGAAIFTLSSPSSSFQPNYRNKARRCELHLKAPDDSHGLMAYVEEMHLRKSTKDGSCVDSVQFGQDDILPFVTVIKSAKHCGEVDGRRRVDRGVFYDDPHGSLLVWLSLGGRRQTSSWPIISVVNLTLVVTAYQKDCGTAKPRPNYKRCRERDRCIWGHYFCDGHINCPKDLIPADEDGCPTESIPPISSTTDPLDSAGDAGGLNTISLTLIVVCSGVILLLVTVVVVRYGKRKHCHTSSPSEGRRRRRRRRHGSSSDEAYEQQAPPRSLVELNRLRHLRETEDNVYNVLPGENRQNAASVTTGSSSVAAALIETSRNEEEPPPAYDELFPTDAVVEDVIAAGAGSDPPPP